MIIRLAAKEDREAIIAIYNQAIDAGFQTAFTERVTVADRKEWFDQHATGSYPLFVCDDAGMVVGWLSVSPYRSGRAALRYCVEVSYFVHNDHQGRGVGSTLLDHAINACRGMSYRVMVAIILDRNMASVKLMRRFDFEEWGRLPGVADFDGVVCGHLYYGKSLV